MCKCYICLAEWGGKEIFVTLCVAYQALQSANTTQRQHFASFSSWSSCCCIVLSGRNMVGTVQMRQRKRNIELIKIVKEQITPTCLYHPVTGLLLLQSGTPWESQTQQTPSPKYLLWKVGNLPCKVSTPEILLIGREVDVTVSSGNVTGH